MISTLLPIASIALKLGSYLLSSNAKAQPEPEPVQEEVSIHRNSIDTGKMRRSSLDPTFLLA